MNNTSSEVREFNLMGHKILFRSDDQDYNLAEEVIKNIEDEFDTLNLNSQQDSKEKMLLLLLKVTLDKIKIEKKYQATLDQLESKVLDTIGFLDKFTVENKAQ
jgi:hypothetical protein